MKSSLKRNLLIGFSISLLLLIFSSAASLTSINNLFSSSAAVAHTNLVVSKLEQTVSVMKDAETGQRGFLITGKLPFLEPYNGAYQKAKTLISEIRVLTSDNDIQQQNVNQLDQLITRRFWKLQEIMDRKKQTGIVDLDEMEQGRTFMDSVRIAVQGMISHEQHLLQVRSATLNRFTEYTPILISIAAVLAILVTIVFYIKTNSDITERIKLQDELMRKDAAISQRIKMIQTVSEKVSMGDYSTRLEDRETDDLAAVSIALNKMTTSLERSFRELSDNEWMQTGIAELNAGILAQDDISVMTQKVMSFIAGYTDSQAGAFYIQEPDGMLMLETTYALEREAVAKQLKPGEGVAGQSARSRKPLLVTDIDEKNFSIRFAAASIKPVNIIVVPLLFENAVKGVLELAALHVYTDREIAYLKNIAGIIAIAVNTAQNKQRLQELLEETQSQSEELMAQQEELEQINSELEAQTQHLQTSEEELKVQSEELIETNTLLEEKSSVLEQRNQLIQQKNLEIETKARDLELSTKYKSEFLANMSHELRTPLNSILLLSRLMAENNEKNLTPDQIQYAKVIQGSGNGLLQLIDEILDLSKIESGKMTIEYLPVKPAEITGGLDLLFAPLAKEKQLRWEIRMGTEVPELIETDKMRLEQILKNLLSNAFKFTQQGSIRLSLYCPPDKPGFICFMVKDTGIGISPEKQELIFEAFQQEDGSTRRKFGGTGLGLSISRKLARLLGGEVTLNSTPGEGSEFVCCIPISPGSVLVHEPAAQIISLNGKAPIAETPSLTHTPSYLTDYIPNEIEDDRARIEPGDKLMLIIEDDVHFARALLDYSREKGYKGLVAVRGDRGIEMALQYLPAGILLDLQLPVKTGWQVMDALKENPLTRHIPVHMMSSYAVKKESLVKGAVNFISKPVAADQLKTIFEKLEYVLSKKGRKVLIIEENFKHAKALAFYLGTYQINASINQSLSESIESLNKSDIDCVILDLSGTPDNTDDLLEQIRKQEGMEDLPVILFTGKNLSQPEEFRLKQYADAIVLKTANSYKRILDEVSLFLHLVQEQNKAGQPNFERRILQENVLKDKLALVADDDVRNIFSMTKILEKYQMSVLPAMDGKEALQLIKTNPVDVVLMDMMMPEMDGYESIRAIRSNPLYKNTPIIAVTAKAMKGDREKCIAAGASDYISKPVDMDQLLSLLRIWLYEKGY